MVPIAKEFDVPLTAVTVVLTITLWMRLLGAVNVDPAVLTDAERSARGIHRLPDSLGAALDCLEADTVLMESLGDLRRRAYLAVKRSEVAAFADMTSAQECFEHFTKI